MKEFVKSLPILSAVVPVKCDSFQNVKIYEWLHEALEKNIQVILVFDIQDRHFDSKFSGLIGYSDPNLEIVFGDFKSPGVTRNAGMERATCDWICFWDADDLPDISNILSAIVTAEESQADVIIGGFRVINSTTSKLQLLINPPTEASQILTHISIRGGLWRVVLKRAKVEKTLFTDHILGEDLLYLYQIGLWKLKILAISSNFYSYYTGQSNQLTANKELTRELELVRKEIVQSASRNKHYEQILMKRLLLTELKYGERDFKKLRKYFTLLAVKPTITIRTVIKLRVPTMKMYKILEDEDVGRINLVLSGGLGNQIFQIAYALEKYPLYALQLIHLAGLSNNQLESLNALRSASLPTHIRLPIEYNPDLKFLKLCKMILRIEGNRIYQGSKRSKFNEYLMRKVASVMYQKIDFTLSEYETSMPSIFPRKMKKKILVGYFQKRVFPYSSDTLESLRNLTSTVTNPKIQSLRAESLIEHPVIVHIRLGDFAEEKKFWKFSEAYLADGLDALGYNSKVDRIWLVSDDEAHAIEFFQHHLRKGIRVIPTKDLIPIEVLQVLQMGSAYLIGASTLGLWGAYLSYDQGAKVIAPAVLFNPKSINQLSTGRWKITR